MLKFWKGALVGLVGLVTGSEETCFEQPDVYPPTPPPMAAEKTTKAANPTTIQKNLRQMPHIVGRAGGKAFCWSPTTSGACPSGLMAILSSLDECRAETACFRGTRSYGGAPWEQLRAHHIVDDSNAWRGPHPRAQPHRFDTIIKVLVYSRSPPP